MGHPKGTKAGSIAIIDKNGRCFGIGKGPGKPGYQGRVKVFGQDLQADVLNTLALKEPLCGIIQLGRPGDMDHFFETGLF